MYCYCCCCCCIYFDVIIIIIIPQQNRALAWGKNRTTTVVHTDTNNRAEHVGLRGPPGFPEQITILLALNSSSSSIHIITWFIQQTLLSRSIYSVVIIHTTWLFDITITTSVRRTVFVDGEASFCAISWNFSRLYIQFFFVSIDRATQYYYYYYCLLLYLFLVRAEQQKGCSELLLLLHTVSCFVEW